MKLKQLTAKLLAFILLLSVSYSTTEGRFGTSRRNEDSIISRGYENRMQPPSVAPENEPSMKKPKDLSNPELWLNGTDNISQAETTEEDVIDFGDHTSEHLIAQAWDSFNGETEQYPEPNYEHAQVYINELIDIYEDDALQQQQNTSGEYPEGTVEEVYGEFWALNDVATAYFILGEIARNEGNNEEALEHYQTIVDNYQFAQSVYQDDDGVDHLYKIDAAARDRILEVRDGFDFDDYSSEHLIEKAWESFNNGNHEHARIYLDKIIEMYEEDALSQQDSLDDYAPEGDEHDYWALNDVGTAYFILGEMALDENTAEGYYRTVVDNFGYAQAWDEEEGAFWKVSKAASGRLVEISEEVDFGDYSSEHLIAQAWDSFNGETEQYPEPNYEHAQVYINELIDMYEETAHRQQAELSDLPSLPLPGEEEDGFEHPAWALNDVATAYLILG